MKLPDQLFKPKRYIYQDYLLWKGNRELDIHIQWRHRQ